MSTQETFELMPATTGAELRAIIHCDTCGLTWQYGQAQTCGWRAVKDKPFTFRCHVCLPAQTCESCKHDSATGACSVCNPEKNDQWESLERK